MASKKIRRPGKNMTPSPLEELLKTSLPPNVKNFPAESAHPAASTAETQSGTISVARP